LGAVVLWRVKDRIEDVTWLNAQEKQVVLDRMAKEAQPQTPQTLKDVWKEPATYVMSAIYLCLVMALTGLLFWMPQLIKSAGVLDTVNIGLLTVIPYVGAVIGNLLIGASSDRHGERRWHMAGCASLTAAGYLVCALFPAQLLALMIGMTMIMTGIIAWMPIFWTIPPRFLTGLAAAAGIALINSLGQLGGIIAPFMVGRIKDLTGTATPALFALCAVSVLAVVLILWGIAPRLYARANTHD
jgi:nitrate/nitrite transporter NarK